MPRRSNSSTFLSEIPLEPKDNGMEGRLLTEKQAAKYLSVSDRKLWGMRKQGEIHHVRFGRSVRYKITDLDEFIDQHRE